VEKRAGWYLPSEVIGRTVTDNRSGVKHGGGVVRVPVSVFAFALSLVDWRKCSSKYRLMAYVLANHDPDSAVGVELSQDGVRDDTGISETTARKYFAELVRERVLRRHDAAGSRGHAYWPNPAFDEWRVPFFGARPPAIGGDGNATEVASREWSAARERALRSIESLLRPPLCAEGPFVARPVARQTQTAARSFARQTSAGAPATQFPLITTTSLATTPASEGAEVVLAAIQARAGAPIYGRPAQDVANVVSGADPARFLAAIGLVPPGAPVLAFVDVVRRSAVEVTVPAPAPRPETQPWAPPDTSDAVAPPVDPRAFMPGSGAVTHPRARMATMDGAE